jgi:peptide/nickel transport system permease protein
MKFGIRCRAMIRVFEREEDYVRAAELMGASKTRIIARHLIPNFMSHLIGIGASSQGWSCTAARFCASLRSTPQLVTGGRRPRPPVTSWGVLLNEAQNLAAVQLHPWLLAPILPVVIVVLGSAPR